MISFIYDLPARLEKCIKSEAYVDAVRYYTGAMPIFKAYGDSSFKDCKRASEEAVTVIIKILQGKLFSDSESIQARAEAAVVLKQLDFPVESLQAKLLEKLEQSVLDLHFKMEDLKNASIDYGDPSREGNKSDSPPANVHEVSVREFVEAIRAYRVIFSDSDEQLIKLARGLIAKHFETTDEYQKNRLSSADLLCVLRIIWKDVLLMEKVFPEGALPDYCLEAAQVSLQQHLSSTFSQLLRDISDALTQTHIKQEGERDNSLQMGLEASKKAVLQGSVDILLDLHQLLLEDSSELLVKLRDFIIDWVQEGFQNFFQAVDNHFHSLARRNSSASHDQNFTEGTQCDRVSAGLVLVLAQLSLYIEQTAISRITEEIAASFSGGSARGFEYGPTFVPGEVCRIFHSSGEKFLHLYISMRTQRMSILLKKRFTTPNWVKHKEPREVHMFVDLFLHELEAIGNEVKQILPQGLLKHRRTESNGSTTSSRSAPLREEKLGRSNTQRARSQLLETHMAKLFKQKVEIVTKVEFNQESVATNVVKLCLKSLQEFVRLQTFNRSGFQQIQLDIQFIRTPIKEIVEDEAAMDFLLDEVIVAASERCLDPVPLLPPILDKLVQAKLAKTKEHNSTSS